MRKVAIVWWYNSLISKYMEINSFSYILLDGWNAAIGTLLIHFRHKKISLVEILSIIKVDPIFLEVFSQEIYQKTFDIKCDKIVDWTEWTITLMKFFPILIED